MRKLLLTSAGLSNEEIKQEFLNLVMVKPIDSLKVIMISEQKNEQDKIFLDQAIENLKDLKIKQENISVFKLDDKFEYNLQDFDLLYMCGGNTYHYLDRIRQLDLVDKIKNFVESGKIYFGVSAGSILATPQIDNASPWDENDVKMKDLTGFNFVDFLIAVHINHKDMEIVRKLQQELKMPFRALTDDQAFLVKGDKIKLVGKGEEYKV